MQKLFCVVNRGLSLHWIIQRQVFVNCDQLRVDVLDHQIGQLSDCEFFRVSQVDWSGVAAVHQVDHSFDEIIDVAE